MHDVESLLACDLPLLLLLYGARCLHYCN